LNNFDTSNATDMKFMFSSCYKLKEINGINNLTTKNVNNMNGLFAECNVLENIDLLNFDTSNVTDMECMFMACYKLNNVTNMDLMFEECRELEYLDLSNFNTSNVTDMGKMFKSCPKLKEIKGINNFDISKVVNKGEIFEGCIELPYSDLSDIHISNDINNKKQSKNDLDEEKNENLKNIEGLNSQCQMMDSSDKKFVLLFRSTNQTINYSVDCEKSNLFSDVEEKLYYEFPELKHKNISFILNGNIIN